MVSTSYNTTYIYFCIFSLLAFKDEVFEKDPNNELLVETIVFDDLIDYFPAAKDNRRYKKAILKIDIEGFEPYAFEKAKHLFDSIEITVIIMSWLYFPNLAEARKEVDYMIYFLFSFKLTPYDTKGNVLDEKEWKTWPAYIVWKKEGY